MAPARIVLRDLALALAAIVASASVAAQGGRFSARLDVLSHFAAVYLALSIGFLVMAAFMSMQGRKLPMALLGAVGAIASLALMAPELLRPSPAAPQPDQGARRIKVIQFNAGGADHAVDAYVAWFRSQAPDAVVMQESTPLIRAAVMERLNLHMTCGLTCDVAIFTKALPVSVERPRRGRHGAGPPVAFVSVSEADGGYTLAGTHYVWPIHLFTYRENVARMALLLRQRPKDRLILTGDFNSASWSFARRREDVSMGLERRDRALATWPATMPFGLAFLPIDHVYAGAGWKTVEVVRGPRLGSDHYPLVATLALASPR